MVVYFNPFASLSLKKRAGIRQFSEGRTETLDMAYSFNPGMPGAMVPAPRQQLAHMHYRPNDQKQQLIPTVSSCFN